jgi:flagellar biosynthetic protein FliO
MQWGPLANTLGALAVVLGAIFATRFVLLRTRLASPTRRRIRVLESRPLAPGSRVDLVEVDGRQLLLGSGQNGVSLLSQLGDDSGRASTVESAPPRLSRTRRHRLPHPLPLPSPTRRIRPRLPSRSPSSWPRRADPGTQR